MILTLGLVVIAGLAALVTIGDRLMERRQDTLSTLDERPHYIPRYAPRDYLADILSDPAFWAGVSLMAVVLAILTLGA